MISYNANINAEGDLISEESTKAYFSKIKKNYDTLSASGNLDELINGKYAKAFKNLCDEAIKLACCYLTENAVRWVGFSTSDELAEKLSSAASLVKDNIKKLSSIVMKGDFEALQSLADEIRDTFFKENVFQTLAA